MFEYLVLHSIVTLLIAARYTVQWEQASAVVRTGAVIKGKPMSEGEVTWAVAIGTLIAALLPEIIVAVKLMRRLRKK